MRFARRLVATGPRRPVQAIVLSEDGCGASQDLIQRLFWNRFDFSSLSSFYVENSRLIAANEPGSLCTDQRHREADAPREITASSDRQDDRKLGDLVEFVRRDDEHWTRPSLLVSGNRIERDEVNVTAIHINSRPAGGLSTHSRSSGGCGAE